MEESGGIAALGIDWKILLAQLINFIIVFWVLSRYAFKPLLKVLDERRAKVEKSVKDAQEIIEEKEHLAQEVEKKLSEANQKAQEIIALSSKAAKQDQARIRQEADSSASKMVAEAKTQITAMKQSMKQEIVKELGELIVSTTKKVIEEEVPTQTKNKIVGQINKEVTSER